MQPAKTKRAVSFNRRFWFSLVALGLICANAWAGRSCHPRMARPDILRDAAAASTEMAQLLNQGEQSIVLIARIGQDLSKHNLLYSHAGFALSDGHGRWQVIHLLNDCGTDRGKLVAEGLLQFYLDDLLSFQTKVVYFPPELAKAVRQALESHQGKAVFQTQYSVIARPFSPRWQNSTAWVLEVIAAALQPGPDSRSEAFDELQRRHYQAQAIQIPYAQRLGAALFRSNIHFLEHPLTSRLSGRYQTTSVRSILRFLRQEKLIARELVWAPSGAPVRLGD